MAARGDAVGAGEDCGATEDEVGVGAALPLVSGVGSAVAELVGETVPLAEGDAVGVGEPPNELLGLALLDTPARGGQIGSWVVMVIAAAATPVTSSPPTSASATGPTDQARLLFLGSFPGSRMGKELIAHPFSLQPRPATA
ncbi:MAG: hypothetical protein Q8M73_11740 [Actinomycetota bacterium]|nr:hypothetical protein [Actinomycetota bacterium]